MTFLSEMTGWLSDLLQAQVAVAVIYLHGSRRIALKATKSEQTVDIQEGDGTTIEAQRTDWILPRAKLLWQGKLQDPVRGDLIHEIVDGRTHVYEVQPVGTESHYRASGASWRVFSRLIRVE